MMDKTGQNPRELPENGFAIYQLKPDPRYHSLRFASLSELRSLSRKKGNHADAALGVTESRYDLVYALDVSVEDILEDYWEELELERAAHTHIPVHDNHALMNFYVLADSMLGRLRATGDLAFIDGIDQNEWIERLYDDEQYRCALFLVGIMDYLCRKNGVRQIARYDEYRALRLDSPVYSLSTLNVDSDEGDYQRARNEAENNAIPELSRYGIYLTEEDIRHPV